MTDYPTRNRGSDLDNEEDADAFLREFRRMLAENGQKPRKAKRSAVSETVRSAEYADRTASFVSDTEPTFSSVRERTAEEDRFHAPSEKTKRKGNKSKHGKRGKMGAFGDVVFYASLLFFVLAVLFIKSGSCGAPVSVFGFSLHNVLTPSMQSEIPKDSLVLTRQVDPASLQIGDDITYMKDERTTVTHRIVGVIEDDGVTGQRAFETKGIMNREPDEQPVPAANVVGKVIFHNHALGVAMIFLNQYWHFLLLLFILLTGLKWSIQSWQKARLAENCE